MFLSQEFTLPTADSWYRKPCTGVPLLSAAESSWSYEARNILCINKPIILLTKLSVTSVKLLVSIRGRPFDSWGGGLWFFVKKKIIQQILENK